MKAHCSFCVFLFISFVCTFLEASNPDDSFYVAGVVEFEPAAVNQASLDQINDNLRGYLDILSSPEANNLDIIVFPELTLNNALHLTYVPDPKVNITPCNNSEYAPFFQELSCAAKNLRKYVVINVLEKENCTAELQAEKDDPRSCSADGLSSFNTNVVFNRDGSVVSRYRKYHVYGEPRNTTYLPELSVFTTDFGVKFGMFICFDINFYSPAIDLLKQGVKDMIFTAFWYSELPFLTAVQLHQSWAYANNVNLLAAGGSYPSIGTTGSGIYAGTRGTLISVMARAPERKLYVANVTKSTHWSSNTLQSINRGKKSTKGSLNGLNLMREYRMEAFTSQYLEMNGSSNFNEQVCHDNFCCDFRLQTRKLSPPEGTYSYKYHLAVFDGDRKYSGNGYTKYRFCAVYACTNSSLETCGTVFDDSISVSPDHAFESITIESDFPSAEKVLIMPNTLDQDLDPLKVDQFEFDITERTNSKHVKFTLCMESDDLLTFGIYANYFDGKSRSNGISKSIFTIIFGVVFIMITVKATCFV